MFHPQTEASEELLLEARRAKDNFLESFKVGIVAVMASDVTGFIMNPCNFRCFSCFCWLSKYVMIS